MHDRHFFCCVVERHEITREFDKVIFFDLINWYLSARKKYSSARSHYETLWFLAVFLFHDLFVGHNLSYLRAHLIARQ